MGTRSLTIMYDTPYRGTRGREIAVMYRQMDGYPTGHGQALKDFLAPFVIVNGYDSSMGPVLANGGACLAAQIIAHFKEGVGNFYLHPAGTRDAGEEYIYEVRPSINKGIRLVVRAVRTKYNDKWEVAKRTDPVIYDGPVGDFDPKAVEEAFNGR